MSAQGGRPAKGGKTMATTERVRPMGGMFGQGMVGQKAMNFGPSLRRILRLLAPHRAKVALVIAFGVISVALSSIGPRVLGRATDLIFGGIIGRQFPAGLTQDQVVDSVRAAGNAQVADMLANMDLVPGQGVDFGAVGQVLLIVTGMLASATNVRTGESVNIMTSTNTTVSSELSTWLNVCCRDCETLSMSLVTRLKSSPRGCLSKYCSGSRLSFSSTDERRR